LPYVPIPNYWFGSTFGKEICAGLLLEELQGVSMGPGNQTTKTTSVGKTILDRFV